MPRLGLGCHHICSNRNSARCQYVCRFRQNGQPIDSSRQVTAHEEAPQRTTIRRTTEAPSQKKRPRSLYMLLAGFHRLEALYGVVEIQAQEQRVSEVENEVTNQRKAGRSRNDDLHFKISTTLPLPLSKRHPMLAYLLTHRHRCLQHV